MMWTSPRGADSESNQWGAHELRCDKWDGRGVARDERAARKTLVGCAQSRNNKTKPPSAAVQNSVLASGGIPRRKTKPPSITRRENEPTDHPIRTVQNEPTDPISVAKHWPSRYLSAA